MRKSSRSTVTISFLPDVMAAIRRFHETTVPDAGLSAAIQELVIIGLTRTTDEGVALATRLRAARDTKRWALNELNVALNEMLGKVNVAIAETGALDGNDDEQG